MQHSSRAAGHRATSSTWPCPRTFPVSSPSLSPARAVLAASNSGFHTTPRRQQHHFATAFIATDARSAHPLAARGGHEEGGQHQRALIHPRSHSHALVPRPSNNHPRAAHEKQTQAQDAPRHEEGGGSEGEDRVGQCEFKYSSVNQNTLVNSYHAIALCNWLLFALLVLYKNR